ncbi:MAG: hypothetical protein HXY34_11120 [Candidatus Thorarchaeota archaeon]|nr:hypothetical protein [Candidatus Thorarchaeota archaeon]
MSHAEVSSVAVSPQVLVSLIRDAHEFFRERMVDDRYEYMALDLIRRYASKEGVPRESDPLFGAALYVVSRHPWSHPNPMTKVEFASKLNLRESSLDWYTNSIVENVGFLTLHDQSRQKFFLDPQDTIMSVLESVVRASVGEEMVKGVATGSVVSPAELSERIVDRLCSVVKIIPPAFEEDLVGVVQRKIEEESQRLLASLGGKHTFQ